MITAIALLSIGAALLLLAWHERRETIRTDDLDTAHELWLQAMTRRVRS